MEMDIIEDKKNPLLSRRDIVCMVTKAGTTPSKNDIHSFVTKELKLKSECVFVDRVHQKYGRPLTEVYVKVYDKPELVPGYVKPVSEVKETPADKKEKPETEDAKEDNASEK